MPNSAVNDVQTTVDSADSKRPRPRLASAILRRLKVLTSSAVLLPLAVGVLAVGFVDLLHRSDILPKFLTPSTGAIVDAMVSQAKGSVLWPELWVTVQEAMIGCVIGAAIGFALGVAVGLSRLVSKALYPYVILTQATPRVVLAPVFVAIFGFGMGSKIVTAVAIAFFLVMINTVIGLQSVEEGPLEVMRAMGASKWQTFKKLLLPGALPMIFGGLTTALPLAFVGAIVAELTAGNAGIGKLVSASAFELDMPSMYGYVLWLSLVTVVVFYLLELAARRVVFWKQDSRDR